MQKVHFTGIGEPAMLSIAIAVSRKNNFSVSGSDDNFSGEAYTTLIENGLWPESPGWHPDRIHKNLNAVVTGLHTLPDNPEIMKARELGLKVYNMAEYLYQQTRSKTRIVVCGRNDVPVVTAMILHVLRKTKMQADFLTSKQLDKTEPKSRLSYESRIAVFEDYDYNENTGLVFQACKPHIAVMTGIPTQNNDTEALPDDRIQKACKLIETMEVQGRLSYFDGDDNLIRICTNLRSDIVAFYYGLPDFEIQNDIIYLKTKKTDIPLKFSGDQNLLSLNAARLACRQIGIYDDQFLNAISDFSVPDNF